jgi:MoaA/NifB/PqqE/SkfB family radical SAM enzyme
MKDYTFNIMNRRRIIKALRRVSNLPQGKYLFLYIANKIRHFYLKSIRSTEVAYPSTIMLELTNRCNLACTICPREYGDGKAMDKGQMSIESAKKIIDELWPYLDSIGLTGMGETFLYNEIEEIVDYIKKKNKGIIISLSTNAVLPDFIEKVSVIIGKIDTIQISVDGVGEIYETIRKNASFQNLDDNLRLLLKMSVNTRTDLMMNMVVTKENYLQMPLLVRYAEEIGIKYLDFTLFNLASITNTERSYYDFYNSPEFLKVISELEETIKKTPDVLVTERNFKTANSFQKCPFPWTHFNICWNGYITPCCAKPFPKELNFGNASEDKVLNILNSTGFRRFRSLWYENKTPDFCCKCHFVDIKPIINTK